MKKMTLPMSIGNTPLVYLKKYSEMYSSEIYLKLEYTNPGGSVKDRAALKILQAALAEGKISPNGTIVEPTSGNTGIALALLSSVFNLKTILVMPESMSIERRQILKSFGAELLLTPAGEGMRGAINKAKEVVEKMDNAFMPDQFNNPQCVLAHYENTAPEIERQLTENDSKLDVFFAGVGSGGTVSGVGKYFKEQDYPTTIVAVEPSTSAVLSGGSPSPHTIEGIGAGFIPQNYYKEYIDTVYKVDPKNAFIEARRIMREEGISCGISGGANLAALLAYAKKNPNKTLVTLIPDGMTKYLSTALIEKE